MEELARLLEIPCFSLETSKLDMDDCNSLERVASELLTAVKEVAPDGPVLLGGLGFGCRIAFEMALQMEAERGEEVKETKTRRRSRPRRDSWPSNVKKHKRLKPERPYRSQSCADLKLRVKRLLQGGNKMLGLLLFEGPVCGPVDVPLPPLVYGLYIASQLYSAQHMEPEDFTSKMREKCFSVEDQLNFVSEFKPANWTQMRYGADSRCVPSTRVSEWL
jgi:hypothetical protein